MCLFLCFSLGDGCGDDDVGVAVQTEPGADWTGSPRTLASSQLARSHIPGNRSVLRNKFPMRHRLSTFDRYCMHCGVNIDVGAGVGF